MKLMRTDYGTICADLPDPVLVEGATEDDVFAPTWDGGYKFYFQRKRAWKRIVAKLKREHIWIKNWHAESKCRRKLPWLEEFREAVARLDKEPQRIHQRIYHDALRRAEQHEEQKGTQA